MNPDTKMHELLGHAVRDDEPHYDDPAGRAQAMGRTLQRRRRTAAGAALGLAVAVLVGITVRPGGSDPRLAIAAPATPATSAVPSTANSTDPGEVREIPRDEASLTVACDGKPPSPEGTPLSTSEGPLVSSFAEESARGIFRIGDRLGWCSVTSDGIDAASIPVSSASRDLSKRYFKAGWQFDDPRGANFAWGFVPNSVRRVTLTDQLGVVRELPLGGGGWIADLDTDVRSAGYQWRAYGAKGNLLFAAPLVG